jgi:hypothetical protein
LGDEAPESSNPFKLGQDAIIFIKKISRGMMILHLREQPICEFYMTESSSWQLTLET